MNQSQNLLKALVRVEVRNEVHNEVQAEVRNEEMVDSKNVFKKCLNLFKKVLWQ